MTFRDICKVFGIEPAADCLRAIDENSAPKPPTLGEEITAFLCEGIGVDRPDGVRTHGEWEQEVLLYWFERMLRLMDRAKKEHEEVQP